MNKDTAQQYLPLVRALADGKLQFNSVRGWEDVGESIEIDFTLSLDHYRIKPEPPLEIKIWVSDERNEAISISSSCDVGQTYGGQTVKLFREVI